MSIMPAFAKRQAGREIERRNGVARANLQLLIVEKAHVKRDAAVAELIGANAR